MNQFVNNNSTVNAVKAASENAYQALVRAIQKLKEIAVELSSPGPLFEQVRILLRDESE